MHRFSPVFTCLLVPALLLVVPVPARPASEVFITVTPTVRTEQQGTVADRTPTAFMDIITPGSEASGVTNTGEALRSSSSVDFSDYGGAPASPLTLRGSNYRETLIMLDGIPLNPVTGDLVDVTRYLLPDIDRIEVIKGSNSASFGKSAMGGTVNIVTSDPSEVDEVDLTATQGSYGMGLYHGHASMKFGRTGLLATITRAFSDNDFRYDRDDGTRTTRQNNGVENTTGLIKATFEVQDWKTSLMGNFIDQFAGSPGSEGSAGYLTPHDKVGTIQATYLAQTSRAIGDNQSIDLRAWMLTSRTHTESLPFGDSRTRLVQESCAASYERKFGIFSVSPRAEYLRERMSSDDYGRHTRSTLSGIMSADMDAQPFLVQLTGRCDDSSEFGSRLSYHAGAAWKALDHVQLRANVGTGYVEPTMGQLYAPSSWYTFIPNPDLEPEKSLGFDVGPTVTFTSFGTGVNYFHTRYRDLIKMDFPEAEAFTYVNVDEARSHGMEASAWCAPASQVMLQANYTLTRSTYESGTYEGNEMKQKPRQVLNLQADWFPEIAGRAATFSVAYQIRAGTYADEANTERTRTRYLLHAGAIYDVGPNTDISFKVDNLLDDQSPEYVDKTPWGSFWYPVAGRTYRFAAKVTF